MTAETAMMLPLLVALTGVLVWVLSLGVDQVRAVDAARESARALARGETEAAAVALGHRVAPPGAEVAVTRRDGLVTVVVTSRVQAPGGLFSAVSGPTLRAEAVALQEDAP